MAVVLVVVPLHLQGPCSADLRRNERDHVQSGRGRAAVHSVHVSGRRLLGPRSRDAPAHEQYGHLPTEDLDLWITSHADPKQSELLRELGLARGAYCLRQANALVAFMVVGSADGHRPLALPNASDGNAVEIGSGRSKCDSAGHGRIDLPLGG